MDTFVVVVSDLSFSTNYMDMGKDWLVMYGYLFSSTESGNVYTDYQFSML